MADILENAEADLTPQMRNLIDMLWNEWMLVERQIEKLNLELERISAADPGCTRIRQIPGIGPVVRVKTSGSFYSRKEPLCGNSFGSG